MGAFVYLTPEEGNFLISRQEERVVLRNWVVEAGRMNGSWVERAEGLNGLLW